MAYRYFTRMTEATKLYNAIYREAGETANILREGKGYRVQCNALGNERMNAIMESVNLPVVK